jgi:hypothetical protein
MFSYCFRCKYIILFLIFYSTSKSARALQRKIKLSNIYNETKTWIVYFYLYFAFSTKFNKLAFISLFLHVVLSIKIQTPLFLLFYLLFHRYTGSLGNSCSYYYSSYSSLCESSRHVKIGKRTIWLGATQQNVEDLGWAAWSAPPVPMAMISSGLGVQALPCPCPMVPQTLAACA